MWETNKIVSAAQIGSWWQTRGNPSEARVSHKALRCETCASKLENPHKRQIDGDQALPVLPSVD